MRWSIHFAAATALALIAGCGRLGFDARGTGEAPGVDSGTSDAPSNDPGGSSGHYITGGTASRSGSSTSISTMTPPLTDANMLLVVAVHWEDTTSSISTVQDAFGNGFSMVGSMRRYNAKQSQAIWVKKVTAGTAINVLFTQPTASIDLQWAAYREIDPSSPTEFDVDNAGTSTTADLGTFTVGTDTVMVSSMASQAADATAGPGFTSRQSSHGGVLEDMETAGVVHPTATLSSSGDWIMHAVALRPR